MELVDIVILLAFVLGTHMAWSAGTDKHYPWNLFTNGLLFAAVWYLGTKRLFPSMWGTGWFWLSMFLFAFLLGLGRWVALARLFQLLTSRRKQEA